MTICTCINSIVVCGQHFHCLQLENSLEMNDEKPKPGTGNSDSTSFVYSQSYDVMFFMFLPQHKPHLSRIFPREIKTRNCCNIPTWKAQNSSYLTRVLLMFYFSPSWNISFRSLHGCNYNIPEVETPSKTQKYFIPVFKGK